MAIFRVSEFLGFLRYITFTVYHIFQLNQTCTDSPCAHGQCSSVNITLTGTVVSITERMFLYYNALERNKMPEKYYSHLPCLISHLSI